MNYHMMTVDSPENGSSAEKVGRGLGLALGEAAKNGTCEVLVLMHGGQRLEPFIATLGERCTKQLDRNGTTQVRVRVEGGAIVTIYLETERRRSNFRKGVILAPFIAPRLLAKALDDSRATDTVYIPHSEAEWQSYVQSNPTSRQFS